jgi:hypothetical protein
MSQKEIWQIWKNGGQVGGVAYVGMQNLVDQIRSRGVANLVWVEGPYSAKVLPARKYLIKGINIVYSIHHPNLNNPASWTRIATLATNHAVVDGEWAQYQSTWAECYSDAYTNAPRYLSFLAQHNIGVIAWSLQANSLLSGKPSDAPTNTNTSDDPQQASALKSPNKILPDYSCKDHFGQGVGQLIQSYFVQNSTQHDLSSL